MADFLLGADVDPAAHKRTDNLVKLASGDFTTHGVIVGMTGSGKTGLGIVLVEEALAAGIPTLLIDPKGDLTNLCLTFPSLSAAEFQPWVNEGDASKAGLSVADFAAAQAKSWTDGLASWDMGPSNIAALRDKVEMTIYTPGSSGGVGLNIVGSLQAPADASDPEVVGDEIEGFVSGLLGLVGIDADPLSSREHILLSNLISNEWTGGRSLDLPILVGMVQQPPIRKLGVFELDSFFPPKDRTALAMRLNGLLASPSFAAWMTGPPLDIDAMLRTSDGRPRAAIVTTAQLSDEERQFVTTLVLSKLVTWMRRQSGTTDLRALLYMDEVAGYLPPTATPPTKKPIMTLMKQARAFGVGVVLSTQNPVDVDYKALSNAGTWMIGRLQTDRDKQRLLDGMSAAAGGVDINAVGNVITGLGKREFVLRRAGKDQPEVFTTRWAMSYLRGPLTRDQISILMSEQKAGARVAGAGTVGGTEAGGADAGGGAFAAPIGETPSNSVGAPGDATPTAPITSTVFTATTSGGAAGAASGTDTTPVMPVVAGDVPVRFADVAAPWLSQVGADPRGLIREAAVVARVALRYSNDKAALMHDEEYEAVLYPLDQQVDVSRAVAVDYDDRDLRTDTPPQCSYRLPDAPVKDKPFWTALQRNLVDHLVRSRAIELQTNRKLKLFSRPGESTDEFFQRCYTAADALGDAETAKLRDKYAAKVAKLQLDLQTAQDRATLLETQQKGRRNEEILSTAGSILGGLLGGRKSRGGMLGSVFGSAGSAAGRRSRTAAAGDRVDAVENKMQSIHAQLDATEDELTAEVTAIDAKWMAVAKDITAISVPLSRSDVQVTQLSLVWLPVS
ncbi:MAG: helicase HerA-like domain-containing protein [Ilumatobacteraceae bacterium]